MKISNYKYLILRRVVQLTILVLYFGGNVLGWKMLTGDLSSSSILGKIPLSDPFAILQMLAAGATIGMNALVGALIIALLYGIIGGRAFCSWVCPVNMVTDAAAWLRRVLYIDKIERKTWISRNARYYMIVIALVVSFISGLAVFEIISPITILNRGVVFGFGDILSKLNISDISNLELAKELLIGFGAGGGLLLAIFLFDLFVVKNGWCGHICPLGGVHSLIGKYSLIRVKHNHENCTLCMKCTTVCPEKPVLNMIGKRSENVSQAECNNCGRCIDVCDDDALGFNIRNFINNKGEKV